MKKIFLSLFFFLVLSSFIYPTLTDNLVGRFNLTIDGNSNYGTFNNLTCEGGLTFDNVFGAFGDGTDNYCHNDAINWLYNNTKWVICLEVNFTDTSGVFNEMKTDGTKGFSVNHYVGGERLYVLPDGNTDTNTQARPLNFWGKRCVMRNVDFYKIWFNGEVASSNVTQVVQASGNDFEIGRYDLTNYYFHGWIRNICIWNVANETLVLDYNSSYCFAEVPITPTLSLSTNLINGTKNYNENSVEINFNGTFTYTYNNFSCSIYDNVSVIYENPSINLSINNLYSYDVTSQTKTSIFKINCSNSNTSATTLNYYYYIDNVLPVVDTSLIDYTNITQYSTNTFSWNCSDNNLFADEMIIRDSLNSIQLNTTNINLTGRTFIHNVTSRLENVVGNFTVNVSCWDSHTNNIIADYKITNLTNGIDINGLKLYSNTTLLINTIKQINKYSFSLKYDTKQTEDKIIFVQGKDLYYLPNSKYKLHFVDFKNKMWLDFEELNKYPFEIRQLDTQLFQITFKTKDTTLSFNSIGDLNYNSILRHYSVKASGTGLTDEQSGWLQDIRNNIILIYGEFQMINTTLNMFFALVVTIVFLFIIDLFAKKYTFWFYLLFIPQLISLCCCLMYFLGVDFLGLTENSIKMVIYLSDLFTFIFIFILYVISLIFKLTNSLTENKEKPKRDFYKSFH